MAPLSDLRTVLGPVRHALKPLRPAQAASAWATELEDPDVGRVRITGELREPPGGSDELVVLVHGLAGSPASFYCERGAALLERAGVATLTIALRGADRAGDDFYNIALTADLHAALRSPALAGYRSIDLVGYSMGGYVAMHYACEAEPRVRGVAALCTPISLLAAQIHIDRRRAAFYRLHVLRGLIEIYAAVAAKNEVPSDVDEVRAVRTMYDWDRLAIAPRYGYDGPEHYYEELGIGPRLTELRVPTLLVACEGDPVVPPSTVLPFVVPGSSLEVQRVRGGGHLTFPRGALGDRGAAGIELELLHWFRNRGFE